MNAKKYILISVLFVIALSCRDESLYPLPYNDRVVGAYLRMYKITSNVFDLNDLNNSAFDVDYEIVDEQYGDNLQEVQFYVSYRNLVNGLTSEVLVKTVPGTDFAAVGEPTYSEYKRANIRITAAETIAALANISSTPPAAWTSGLLGLGSIPATWENGAQIIYRWQLVLKDGRKFSVLNPQGTNPEENNHTPNITTGQFYSAPSTFTMPVRNQVATGSWEGDYSLTQSAIWSPAHSYDFHANYPNYLKEILFPDQTVTLSTVSGGLSTERQFQVTYKGQTTTMKINLEPTPTTATPSSGTVYVPLQDTQVDCSAERGIYWTWPTSGNFTKGASSTVTLVAPLPTGTVANRGSFNTTQTGLNPGQSLTIGVDDDCDEYGRRNGYCTWTRRVRLTLTKL